MTATRPTPSPTSRAPSCLRSNTPPLQGRGQGWGRSSALGVPPLLRLPQHVISRLHRLEPSGRLAIAGGGVGMIGFGEPAIGRLDLVEAGVDLDLQGLE